MNTENGTNSKQLSVIRNFSLSEYITTFSQILEKLGTENVVIGGTHALQLHGIKMSRKPSDLDIIIFKPTLKQLEFLDNIRVFNILDTRNEPEYPIDQIKLLKFKKRNGLKEELFIDVILSDQPLKENYLIYVHNKWREKVYYKVNDVTSIIDAKVSYTFEQKKQDQLRLYIRQKDVSDLQDYKNLNFNF